MHNAPGQPPTIDPETEPRLKTLAPWQQLKLLVAYGWAQRRVQVISTALIFLVIVPLLAFWKALGWPSSHVVATENPATWLVWLNNFQIVFGCLTLLVAIFVWFNELREEWEHRLPLKMSIFFFLDRKPVIVCQHVWLSSVGDLRQWAQQVASQAVNGAWLKFSPNVVSTRSDVCQSPDGSACVLHSVKFQLNELPPDLLQRSSSCRYQNLLVGDKVRDVPIEDVLRLPEVSRWQGSAPSSSSSSSPS